MLTWLKYPATHLIDSATQGNAWDQLNSNCRNIIQYIGIGAICAIHDIMSLLAEEFENGHWNSFLSYLTTLVYTTSVTLLSCTQRVPYTWWFTYWPLPPWILVSCIKYSWMITSIYQLLTGKLFLSNTYVADQYNNWLQNIRLHIGLC